MTVTTGVHENSLVRTDKGDLNIKALSGHGVYALNGMYHSYANINCVGKTHKLLYIAVKNEFDDELSDICCAPEQLFTLENGDKVKAINLKSGDHLLRWYDVRYKHEVFHRVIMKDTLIGDFTTYEVKESVRGRAVIDGILVG